LIGLTVGVGAKQNDFVRLKFINYLLTKFLNLIKANHHASFELSRQRNVTDRISYQLIKGTSHEISQ
jgi:hypothetical protein